MSTRPYLVLDAETGARRLVRASSRSVAIAHVVRGRFTARPVTGAEVLDLLDAGLAAEPVDSRQAEIDAEPQAVDAAAAAASANSEARP